MPIDCEVHDEAVMEVGRLQKRVAELEAALRRISLRDVDHESKRIARNALK